MKPLASELKRPPPSAEAAPPAKLVPPVSGMSASGASDHGLNGVLSVFCCVPVPDDIPDVVPDDEPDVVPDVVENACAAGSTMPNCAASVCNGMPRRWASTASCCVGPQFCAVSAVSAAPIPACWFASRA